MRRATEMSVVRMLRTAVMTMTMTMTAAIY